MSLRRVSAERFKPDAGDNCTSAATTPMLLTSLQFVVDTPPKVVLHDMEDEWIELQLELGARQRFRDGSGLVKRGGKAAITCRSGGRRSIVGNQFVRIWWGHV